MTTNNNVLRLLSHALDYIKRLAKTRAYCKIAENKNVVFIYSDKNKRKKVTVLECSRMSDA